MGPQECGSWKGHSNSIGLECAYKLIDGPHNVSTIK